MVKPCTEKRPGGDPGKMERKCSSGSVVKP